MNFACKHLNVFIKLYFPHEQLQKSFYLNGKLNLLFELKHLDGFCLVRLIMSHVRFCKLINFPHKMFIYLIILSFIRNLYGNPENTDKNIILAQRKIIKLGKFS